MAATAKWKATSEKLPAQLRNAMKQRRAFICTECLQDCEGWAYEVSARNMAKREVCGPCWAAPRVPPMKPIGLEVAL